jgi:transcriptional regulator GlxA family with amidase domain
MSASQPLPIGLAVQEIQQTRLFEYLFVLLIRSAMNARLIDSGILMGLSDARLSRAVEAMHQHPETYWSLEQLAQLPGMSRARFAVYFRQVVGMRHLIT